MIALGVGIDYALFIVTRYREALHAGLSVEDSVVEAMDTSGRAVIFAGLTVMISLLGLTAIGLPFVNGIAIGMATGVLLMIFVRAHAAAGVARLDRPTHRQHHPRRIGRRRRDGRGRVRRRHLRRSRRDPVRTAGVAGVLRPQLLRRRHEAVPRARPSSCRTSPGAALLVSLEPHHPAPPLARCAGLRGSARSPRDPALLDPSRLRRLRQPPRTADRETAPTTSSPKDLGPVQTDRSSSPFPPTWPPTRTHSMPSPPISTPPRVRRG